ncbi:GNAT family N-acetyltransferase [Sutcliffiella cohnii]|uniref:GNAT family N-acetyltransferase n=1 Tax=Sutcliffiella cohnii TaxID=33932 RepID=UPI002E20E7CA|nr:GNAT family N-acetyltransferase [Sutcliffiella cohnii]
MIFQRDSLLVRKLKDSDKTLLAKWLSNPTILQYYEGRDNPHNIELVTKHFFNVEDHYVTGCIVQYEGVEIGYIQYYPIEEEYKDKYGYNNRNEIVYGMDQFIGESSYWNRGIGTELVRGMVYYLINELKVDVIAMDPQAWNERAVACYEKCGFKKVKLMPKHEWHEGEYRDCWLVEYRRENK